MLNKCQDYYLFINLFKDFFNWSELREAVFVCGATCPMGGAEPINFGGLLSADPFKDSIKMYLYIHLYYNSKGNDIFLYRCLHDNTGLAKKVTR